MAAERGPRRCAESGPERWVVGERTQVSGGAADDG